MTAAPSGNSAQVTTEDALLTPLICWPTSAPDPAPLIRSLYSLKPSLLASSLTVPPAYSQCRSQSDPYRRKPHPVISLIKTHHFLSPLALTASPGCPFQPQSSACCSLNAGERPGLGTFAMVVSSCGGSVRFCQIRAGQCFLQVCMKCRVLSETYTGHPIVGLKSIPTCTPDPPHQTLLFFQRFSRLNMPYNLLLCFLNFINK